MAYYRPIPANHPSWLAPIKEVYILCSASNQPLTLTMQALRNHKYKSTHVVTAVSLSIATYLLFLFAFDPKFYTDSLQLFQQIIAALLIGMVAFLTIFGFQLGTRSRCQSLVKHHWATGFIQDVQRCSGGHAKRDYSHKQCQ